MIGQSDKEKERALRYMKYKAIKKRREEERGSEREPDQVQRREERAEAEKEFKMYQKLYEDCLAKGVHDDDWCRSEFAPGRSFWKKVEEFTIGTPNEHKNAILLDKCLEKADKQELLRENGASEDVVSLARDADRKECYDQFPVSNLQTVKDYGRRGYDVAKRCVGGLCGLFSTKNGGRTKRKGRRVKRKTKGRRVKRKTKGRRVKRKTKRRRVKRKTKRRKKRKRTKKR
jgi:hypothetical protein